MSQADDRPHGPGAGGRPRGLLPALPGAAQRVRRAHAARVDTVWACSADDGGGELLINPRLDTFERAGRAELAGPGRGRRRAAVRTAAARCCSGAELCGVRGARVQPGGVGAHARHAAVAVHACRLPLARRVHGHAGAAGVGGAAPEEARAGRRAARAQLQRGQLRLRRRAGHGRGGALPAVQEAGLRAGLPCGRGHPRVREAGGGGRLRRRRPPHPHAQRAARHLRARVPAGRPVREGLPAGQEGRGRGHRRARTLRRGFRA